MLGMTETETCANHGVYQLDRHVCVATGPACARGKPGLAVDATPPERMRLGRFAVPEAAGDGHPLVNGGF